MSILPDKDVSDGTAVIRSEFKTQLRISLPVWLFGRDCEKPHGKDFRN